MASATSPSVLAAPNATGPDATGPDAAGPDAAGPDATGSDATGSDAVDAAFEAAAAYDLGRLHVETFGPSLPPATDGASEAAAPDAPLPQPVLLLHGWGSRLDHVRGLAEGLAAAGHRAVALDLPGHGTSPPPPAPWGVPEHAALVCRVLDTHVLSAHALPGAAATARVAVVGHSNGGRIALYMASRPPFAARLDRLALVAPSGITPRRSAATRLKAGLAKALKAPLQALPNPLRTPALDWLRHSLVWKALGSSDYSALTGVMRATFVRTVTHHLDDEVARVTAPTLIFWGTRDAAVSRYQVETLADRVPDAGLVPLDGAGHYAHLDAPGPVLAGIRHFLADR